MTDVLPVEAVTWDRLRQELPGLAAWVSDHGEEAEALTERIRVGNDRRIEAVRAGDDEAVVAIEERLATLSQQMWGLDHSARRMGVIRALLYLQDLAGPCAVEVTVPDCLLRIRVEG